MPIRPLVDPRAKGRLQGLGHLKIPLTLDTECEPFRPVAKFLYKPHYPSAPPDVPVHIEMRRLELLGNMRIMDET
jgi:hypothetical protein